MVYTITCNPSLDYGVTVENFQMGHTNRHRDRTDECRWQGDQCIHCIKTSGDSYENTGIYSRIYGKRDRKENQRAGNRGRMDMAAAGRFPH